MKLWNVTLMEYTKPVNQTASDDLCSDEISISVVAGDPDQNGGEEAVAKAKASREGFVYKADGDVPEHIVVATNLIGLSEQSHIDII